MARRFVPIEIGRMAKAGDAPHLPKDVSEELVNVFLRPGPRVEMRPPWKSDVLGSLPTTGSGYMEWRDQTNNVDRLVLAHGDINVKALAPSEDWGAAIVGAIDGMRDSANFQKAVYWMAGNSGGVPQRYSYNGTTLDIDPFRERLSSESIVPWKNRLWLFNVYQFVNNRLGAADAYGDGAGLTVTNITVSSVVTNGVTLTRWTPTNASSAKGEIPAYIVPASTEDTYIGLRSDLLGLSPLYRMPMTMELYVAQAAPRSSAVLVGTIRRPTTPNGFAYRATASAGNTGAGEPAWDAGEGTNTTDGGVTWHNIGPEAFISREIEIDNATDNRGKFQTEGALARIPPMPATMILGARWKFGTEARTSWELHPVGMGLRDGLADADLRKANKGHQVTVGRFFYDFFNKQSADTAAIQYPNRLICCEAGLPKEWPNELFWEMTDGQGGGVVARPMREFMCLHKRDAISVYQIVEGAAAAKSPVRYVGTFHGTGAIHTRVIGEHKGIQYFIGEHGVYAFDVVNAPVEITDDGMREAIFERGATWVETVSLTPILEVDDKNSELRVYTQSTKVWVYSINRQAWTSINTIKDAEGGVSTLIDMACFRDKFYEIATTNKLVREDVTGTQDDVYNAGVTSFDVLADVWLHPFESIPRNDVLIEFIEVHHEITGVQGASVLEVGVSFDRGATFPKEHEITIPITSDKQPIQIPLWQSGPNLTVRLRYRGKAGPSYFNLFWVGAMVQDLGVEMTDSTPATVSATLVTA